MASLGSRLADIFRLRVRSLLRRERIEHELDDELRFHFDSVVDRYVQSGMSKADALLRARIEYGGPTQIKEKCRDMRGMNFIESIGRDITYAVRGLMREKAFTAMAAATIALAIGVNTGLFTLVYSLLYRPIPVSDPDSLRNVFILKRGEGRSSSYGSRHYASFNELMYLRAHSKTAEFAGVSQADLSWKGNEPLRGQLVSDNLLSIIGGKPVVGRFFTREEASSAGSAPVVVLSHTIWQNKFGGEQDVVGRPMVVNRTMFTIIGVADEKCTGPLMTRADVWIPLTMQGLTRPGEILVDDPAANWIQVIAKRKAGISDTELASETTVLAQQAIAPHLPKKTASAIINPPAFLNMPEVMQQGRPVIVILFAAVTLVLLLACANVANMLLARGLNRRREIAIRLAIGSGRQRLLQQLLVESMVLGVIASIGGLLIGAFGISTLLRMLPVSIFGRTQIDGSPDPTILGYTLAVSLLTSVVFGLVPAMNCLRVDLTPTLKTEGLQSAVRPRRMWLQNALIGVQVSVCVVLLATAALLLRGLQSGLNLDPGFASKNVLIASMDFRQQQYTPEKAARVLNGVRDAVMAVPGVYSASASSLNPILSDSGTDAHTIGSDGKASESFQISFTETDPNFFATMKVPLLQGRPFTPAEYATAAKVAIIDERFAQAHFKDGAIGKHIRRGDRPSDEYEIIGVATTTRAYAIDKREVPRMYIPLTGLRFVESRLLVSYTGPQIEIVRAVEKAAAGFDPGLTVRAYDIAENVSSALMPVKMAAAAAGALAGLALVLACTGLYGVVSFAVSWRRREVGIRLALGAARAHVLRMLLRQGLTPVFIGAVIGIAFAAGAAQLIRALLYGISPIDPVAFGGTIALLTGVATLAALIPARAALSVDPAITLRHD